MARVLVADDDQVICDVLQEIVSGLGHEVEIVTTAADAIEAAAGGSHDLVLLDLKFPDCEDLSTLEKIRTQSPATDVIIVTAESDNLNIVAEATRLGAFDYVPKPIREDDIRIRVTRVMEKRELLRVHAHAVTELASGRELQDIIGVSPDIISIVKEAQELAFHDMPVLITGETGTGKELIARALHYAGPRRDQPFISINCAALPKELTESELFGHEKGSFTGAHVARQGAFEEAESGTVFLDEIGDMSLGSQAALLRVLESGEFRSVGGKDKKTAARIVLATNQELDELIQRGFFRKDLYYRINRIRLNIPPLRKRTKDIAPLAHHFLAQLEAKIAKGIQGFATEAILALESYEWPGNARELKNEIERAYIHTRGSEIRRLDLSAEVVASTAPRSEDDRVAPATLEEIQALISALKTSDGNVTKAADILGVHRNTIHRWMKKYSLQR